MSPCQSLRARASAAEIPEGSPTRWHYLFAVFDYSRHNKRWRALRLRVLRRDHYRCREAARYGRIVQADVVHHVWPAEDWPEYAYCEWNLVSLSQAAHDSMHDRNTGRLTELGESWRRRTIPPGSNF